ncbi:MAG: hypothetical protein M3Y53_08815, partial [Thermoproteota archaeon]|nr:hypothetical protein [Thermoproteota archaeon]
MQHVSTKPGVSKVASGGAFSPSNFDLTSSFVSEPRDDHRRILGNNILGYNSTSYLPFLLLFEYNPSLHFESCLDLYHHLTLLSYQWLYPMVIYNPKSSFTSCNYQLLYFDRRMDAKTASSTEVLQNNTLIIK